MILAFDTYYFNDKAKTVCLCFEKWTDNEPLTLFSDITCGISPYVPGEFYKRELPCILSLLDKITVSDISYIVVDGYVYLDDKGGCGLGGYLFEALGRKIPVIGVAKSEFHNNSTNVRELKRGKSKNPLYISAAGIDPDTASDFIKSMKGEFRIPSLLRVLDRKTKEDM